MRGTFTTVQFANRAAYMAAKPSGVLVAHNDFVLSGLDWMWRMLIGGVRNEEGGLSDHLGKGRLIVGNGTKPVDRTDTRLAGELTAWAELDDGYPQVAVTDSGVAATFRATFAEDVANFEWSERGVTSVQGVLLDRSVQDQGRKVAGAIWTMEAELELTTDPAKLARS